MTTHVKAAGEGIDALKANNLEQKDGWLMNLLGYKYLIFLFRFILGGVFLVSSLGKMPDIERYSVDAVYNFGVLPMFLARPFGLVMPFIELAIALALLFGVLTRLAALGSGLMSIAFFIAKAFVLSQGRQIECGCFGAVVDTLASVTIFMDIPMLILSAAVMFAPFHSRNWLGFGKMLPEEWKQKLHLVW
jgi:uncharacterized membrane protein YphA (DoxX/SURF4 family)